MYMMRFTYKWSRSSFKEQGGGAEPPFQNQGVQGITWALQTPVWSPGGYKAPPWDICPFLNNGSIYLFLYLVSNMTIIIII